MPSATNDAKAIRRAAGECLRRVPLEERFRLLGVRVGTLSRPGAADAVSAPQQGDLFAGL